MSSLPINPRSTPVAVFSTTGSEYLADGIFKAMKNQHKLMKKLIRGNTRVIDFSNQNVEVQVTHNVRGHFAVIVHTQVIKNVNRDLFELFALIDALQNAKVGGILVVFPYMPYVRSDRKDEPRKSTMAKTLAIILNSLGIEHFLIFDPHSAHVPHYFTPAAITMTVLPYLVHCIKQQLLDLGLKKEHCAVVFADAGSVKRFEEFPNQLGFEEAFVVKKRDGTREDVKARKVVGDVQDKHCFMVDDEVLTGKTVLRDTEILLSHGAKSVSLVVVHGIIADSGLDDQRQVALRLQESPVERIIVTNSVPCHTVVDGLSKFTVIDIIPTIAEATYRTMTTESVSELMRMDADVTATH